MHMPRKKHLDFYIECMIEGKMRTLGLCSAAGYGLIDVSLLDLLSPEETDKIKNMYYWASGTERDEKYKFTPLRQTIVLFMAAINNEL